MKQKHINIYLHPVHLTVSWSILDDAHQVIQTVSRGDLSQFPTDTDDCKIVLFVPTENILLTQVQLPKLSRQRLMQALPFALEEQLIEDTADLHFAIGEYQSDGTLPVAVVSHTKMSEWLTLCDEIKVTPQAIIPSVFLVPETENHRWHINIDNNHCIVRTNKFSGFACEKENLAILLELQASPKQDQNILNLQTEQPEEQLLEKANPEQLAFINLLQGAYQPKPIKSQTKKIWLISAYLTIAAIALSLTSNLVSLLILQQKATKLETAINTIYKHNFPNAKSIVAPKERMADKLRAVSGQTAKNHLLILLGDVGKALSEASGVRIQNLDFREQQLSLEMSAGTFEALDKFTHTLTQQGLTVKQQNAATSGNQVKATILVKQGVA